jgi:hypothetical protein
MGVFKKTPMCPFGKGKDYNEFDGEKKSEQDPSIQ